MCGPYLDSDIFLTIKNTLKSDMSHWEFEHGRCDNTKNYC